MKKRKRLLVILSTFVMAAQPLCVAAEMQDAEIRRIKTMQEVLSEWQPLFARLPCRAEIGDVPSILHSAF